MDGIPAEMLKHGGNAVVEWMFLKCRLGWDQGLVPEDWGKAIIIPLNTDRGGSQECVNYREISLLSVPGKEYETVLTQRLLELMESKVK